MPLALLLDIFENTLTEGTHACWFLIRVHLEEKINKTLESHNFCLQCSIKQPVFGNLCDIYVLLRSMI